MTAIETMVTTNKDVLRKLEEIYTELFAHDGYGHIEVDMRILKRGQKEVIVRCGKEFRFVVDYPCRVCDTALSGSQTAEKKTNTMPDRVSGVN